MTERENELFEKWWEDEGQYHRAGGNEYCKTFAYHAWEAVVNREGYKLVPLDSLNEVISCAVTYISDRCNADEAQEVYDHIDRLEEDTP